MNHIQKVNYKNYKILWAVHPERFHHILKKSNIFKFTNSINNSHKDTVLAQSNQCEKG